MVSDQFIFSQAAFTFTVCFWTVPVGTEETWSCWNRHRRFCTLACQWFTCTLSTPKIREMIKSPLSTCTCAPCTRNRDVPILHSSSSLSFAPSRRPIIGHFVALLFCVTPSRRLTLYLELFLSFYSLHNPVWHCTFCNTRDFIVIYFEDNLEKYLIITLLNWYFWKETIVCFTSYH